MIINTSLFDVVKLSTSRAACTGEYREIKRNASANEMKNPTIVRINIPPSVRVNVVSITRNAFMRSKGAVDLRTVREITNKIRYRGIRTVMKMPEIIKKTALQIHHNILNVC
jgi:hypothetical protein